MKNISPQILFLGICLMAGIGLSVDVNDLQTLDGEQRQKIAAIVNNATSSIAPFTATVGTNALNGFYLRKAGQSSGAQAVDGPLTVSNNFSVVPTGIGTATNVIGSATSTNQLVIQAAANSNKGGQILFKEGANSRGFIGVVNNGLGGLLLQGIDPYQANGLSLSIAGSQATCQAGGAGYGWDLVQDTSFTLINGCPLKFSSGSGNTSISSSWSTNYSVTPPLILTLAEFSTNVVLTGVSAGSPIHVGSTVSTPGVAIQGICTNSGFVVIKFINSTAGNLTPAAETISIRAFQ